MLTDTRVNGYKGNSPAHSRCAVDLFELGGAFRDFQDVFSSFQRKFSMKTVLMLGEQMINRIEYLHSKACTLNDPVGKWQVGESSRTPGWAAGLYPPGLEAGQLSDRLRQQVQPCALDQSRSDFLQKWWVQAQVYLIDFGLAKRYRDSNNQHIPWSFSSVIGLAGWTLNARCFDSVC